MCRFFGKIPKHAVLTHLIEKKNIPSKNPIKEERILFAIHELTSESSSCSSEEES